MWVLQTKKMQKNEALQFQITVHIFDDLINVLRARAYGM